MTLTRLIFCLLAFNILATLNSSLSAQVNLEIISTSMEMPTLSKEAFESANPFTFIVSQNGAVQDFDRKKFIIDFEIKGNGVYLQTNAEFNLPYLSFDNQNNLILQSSDIAYAFDADNLNFSGISKQQYQLNGFNPGVYDFCFQVKDVTYDFQSPASSKECVKMWVNQQLPPAFLSPSNKSIILRESGHDFVWMPRHVTSLPVEYTFYCFESDNGVTPNELFLYYNPVLELKSFDINLLGSEVIPNLDSNKDYISFVKVSTLYSDIKFINDGISDPLSFTISDEIEKQILRDAPEPGGCDIPPSDVIINEISQGGVKSNEEYIELLVVGAKSQTPTIDLTGYVIDDNNIADYNNGNQQGHIRIGSCGELSAVPVGTLVVIYNDKELQEVQSSGADGVIYIPFSGSCIEKYAACPSPWNSSYGCGSSDVDDWKLTIPMRNFGDALQLRSPSLELEHAIVWGDAGFSLDNSAKVVTVESGDAAFGEGNDWFDSENWTGTNSMGEPNSYSNEALITALKDGNLSSNFSINCGFSLGSGKGSSGRKITLEILSEIESTYDIFITLSNSSNLDLNGVETNIGTIETNSFDFPLNVIGIYEIRVVNVETGCEDICIVDVGISVDLCKLGDPCDDGNDCTINDVIVDIKLCTCQGQDISEVTIIEEPLFAQTCDYCVSLFPILDPNGNETIIEIVSITFLDQQGNEIFIDADYEDSDFPNGFSFPECFGVDCANPNKVAKELNTWLENSETYFGNFVVGGPSNNCYEGSYNLFLNNSNIKIVNIETSNFNDDQVVTISESNCQTENSNIVGYNLQLESLCDITNISWSTGESSQSIIIPSVENACYAVSITSDCQEVDPNVEYTCYTELFYGGNCNDDCAPGACCIVGEPCPFDDLCAVGAYWDENCMCNPIWGQDSDEDGFCDLVDICAGFSDYLDSDKDGVPDGCDECPGQDDALYHAGLATENDSSDDIICGGDYNHCDYFTAELHSELINFPTCNYCVDFSSFENLDNTFLNILSFKIDGISYNIDPKLILNYNGEPIGRIPADNANGELVSFLTQQIDCADLTIEYGTCGSNSIYFFESCAYDISISFYKIVNVDPEEIETYIFTGTSDNCNDFLPNVDYYELTLDVFCPDPYFEFWNPNNLETSEWNVNWSNESDSPSIIVEGNASHTANVYCHRCHLELTFENENSDCEFGTPCEVECNSGFFEEGTWDAYCNCIPVEWVDADYNGEHDCIEIEECPCLEEPYLTCPSPILNEVYSIAINLTPQLNSSLSYFNLSYNNTLYRLNTIDGFNFHYPLQSIGIDNFMNDLQTWAYEELNIELQISNNNSVYTISGFESPVTGRFGVFTLNYGFGFTSSKLFQSGQPALVVSKYTVEVIIPNCEICSNNNVKYSWSNDENNSSSVAIINNLYEGVTVSVGCSNISCKYILSPNDECDEWNPNCIIGGSCDDANICTVNDVYIENCICQGSIPEGADTRDDDNDGVFNYCDVCQGYDDNIDTDADGYPNGCDVCEGSWDSPLSHDDDPENDPIYEECDEPCEFITVPANTYSLDRLFKEVGDECSSGSNGIVNCTLILPDGEKVKLRVYPQYFDFTYYLEDYNPGTLKERFDGMFNGFKDDLNTWISNNGYTGYATYESDSESFEFFVNETNLKFESLSFICFGEPSLLRSFDYSIFFRQHETTVGAPCDDGDDCTINDTWDANCNCYGEFNDSDGDSVCDTEESCSDWPDHIGCVPCIENANISACRAVNFLIRASTQSDVASGSVKLIQQSAYDVQCRLEQTVEFLEGFDPGIPGLLEQLQDNTDSDGDGIIDILDLCPDKFKIPNSDGYYTNNQISGICQCLNNPEGAKKYNVVKALQFEVVNKFFGTDYCNTDLEVYDENNELIDFDELAVNIESCTSVNNSNLITPGCADELGIAIYEDENCVIRIEETHCVVQFGVDCYGACYVLPDVDLACGSSFDDPIDLLGDDCPDAGDPEAGDCMIAYLENCVWKYEPIDMDGDGICDPDDPCVPTSASALDGMSPEEIENEFGDADGDGIQGCLDDCDGPGTVGSPCDDGDPCTFNDVMTAECNCIGFLADLDGDGIYDCESCEEDNGADFGGDSEPVPCEPCGAAVDEDGDGHPDSYAPSYIELNHDADEDGTFDGFMDAEGNFTPAIVIDDIPQPLVACDVCPGLDDTVDENGDGFPDCIIPPHYDIGCPQSITPVAGQGLVLTFPNDGDIEIDDLPEPVSFTYYDSSNQADNIDYLTIDYVSESSNGYEVFYAYPDMFSLSNYMSVSYGSSQPCSVVVNQGESQLNCPTDISFDANGNLVLDFNIEQGQFNTESIGGELLIDLYDNTGIGDDLSTTYEIEEQDLNGAEANMNIPTSATIGEIQNYVGSITLPDGIICEIQNGNTQQQCFDDDGNPVAVGDPCDDKNISTVNDRYIMDNGNCDCAGVPGPTIMELNCPSSLVASDNVIVMLFDSPDGFEFDIESIVGDINLFSENQLDEDVSIIYDNITSTSDGIEIKVYLDPSNSFNTGTLTLPNGITCNIQNGSTQEPEGCAGIIPGDPCDDGDPCTHHDHYQQDCSCKGDDDSPDSDGDGICDVIDECDGECPCAEIIPEGEGLINGGGDFEIQLNMDNAAEYDDLNVSITGGPSDTEMTGIEFNSPLVIPNLEPGYNYTISLTANCPNGGTNDYTTTIEVPFSDSDIFCGSDWEDVDLNSITLLPELVYGDVFMASDFEVTVKSVEGSYGNFTGKGYIKVPYLNSVRINVKWNNIKISHGYQMIDGFVEIDGYGFAILGDEISDAINEGVNVILNGLETASEILGEVLQILEGIEDLVETTGHLVSEGAKNCVQNASDQLKIEEENLSEIIENENSTEAEIEAAKLLVQNATTALNICMENYNNELAAILEDLLKVINLTIGNISSSCQSGGEFADWEDWTAYDFSPIIAGYEAEVEDILLNGMPNSGGSGISETEYELGIEGVIIEEIDESSLDQTKLQTAQEYYEIESTYQICYVLDSYNNSTNGFNGIESAIFFAKLFLAIGEDIAIEVGERLENETPIEISSDQDFIDQFKTSLIESLIFKAYEND